MNSVNIPRVMLAACSSGSGKTMITCGVLQALVNRGLRVSGFKTGPDYIDPMFHGKVMGIKSKNLDTFFTNDDVAKYLLGKEAVDSDIAVLEGVMGYYDGLGGTSPRASSYDLAHVTGTPVVLIVNSKGMSLSVIPTIKGFMEFMPGSSIAGVILNRMNPMMLGRLKPEIENTLGIKVLGCVPESSEYAVESRHLGLVTPDEIRDIKNHINGFAEVIEKNLDLDMMINIAKSAKPLEYSEPVIPHLPEGKNLKIAVANDAAFCFHYRDNLELIKDMGAEVVFFSPLKDKALPEGVDGLILYGGYPEVYAANLSGNVSMMDSIREAIKGGLPYLAECGGFMYLHKEMEGMDAKIYPMVGVIDGEVHMTGKLTRFGYVTLDSGDTEVFGNTGVTCRAHEFHYYDSSANGESFTAKKLLSERSWRCCHVTERSVAGFPHFYYYSNPEFIYSFLKRCNC
ncbi:MAG: cobyrinate a,c-diamide synthase [Lachnospiraceae bacterium]|nr:cobyrinate a,c-diamide synthase [Lachnospiraceae bacterium]